MLKLIQAPMPMTFKGSWVFGMGLLIRFCRPGLALSRLGVRSPVVLRVVPM